MLLLSYILLSSVADPKILKGERRKCICPHCTLWQMHIMNYTHFIQEKATYLKKILMPIGGSRLHRPSPPFESATD